MEIVKYLCEFFFTSFWHWLGLWFILGALDTILRRVYVKLIESKNN